MKFILIFLLFSQICISQTSLDSICFELINSYRDSKNKIELKWSESAFQAAELHTIYMINENKLSHIENVLVNPQDRLQKFRKNFLYVGENILFFQFSKYSTLSDLELSKNILNLWKDSKEHHKILLTDSEYGSISSIIVDDEKTGTKTVWSTFLVFEP